MAPARVDSSTSHKYSGHNDDNAATGLSNDAVVLRNLMSQQHRTHPNQDESVTQPKKHPQTESIVLECDEHTGCHRAGTNLNVNHQSTSIPVDNSEPHYQNQQHIIIPEAADTEQSSKGGQRVHPGSSVIFGVDDYEQLEELYRNCHHSAVNQYSHLLDCFSENHHDHHDDNQELHRLMPVSDKDATILRSSLRHIAHPDTRRHNDLIESTPRGLTLFLISILLVAVMLVAIVDVVCRVRKPSSSDDKQDDNNRRKKRQLRAKLSRRLLPVYNSAVVQDEKTSGETGV